MNNSPYLDHVRDLKVLRDLLREHEDSLGKQAEAADARRGRRETVSVAEELNGRDLKKAS